LEKLRCNLCGNVYTAAAPAEAGEKKYDETAVAMMAILRYGTGVPWNRTEGLEANFGIPLPAATQCEVLTENAVPLQPALEEFKRQAAQGEVVHNDDTSMRVLSLDRDADISPERTGVFTTGLVWIVQKLRIALYFTGCKHAGENLAEVLKLRSPDLPAIIQVCDALSRNVPKIGGTLVANCNAHYLESVFIRSDSMEAACNKDESFGDVEIIPSFVTRPMLYEGYGESDRSPGTCGCRVVAKGPS
jgi:hypothetical protein